jgi:two-component system, sporulation sensor kinase E
MLNKFSASAKLYLLLLITAASLIGLGLYGIDDLKKMNANTQTLYVDRVLPFQQLSNVRFQYTSVIIPIGQKVKNHLLTFSAAQQRIREAQKIINANWHAYKLSYLTAAEALLAKQTEVVKKQADDINNELLSALLKKDGAALDELIKNKFSTDPAPFTVKLTQLMDLQVNIGKQIFKNNNEIYHATAKKSLLLILLSLFIAISLSFLIIKNINKLIKDILTRNRIIKESQEKYHSLFEQASDAIYILNAKGNFTNVNNSMCELTGYTRDELLAMNVSDLVNAELVRMNPLLYLKVKTGETVTGERKIVHKSGVIVDVEINGKKFTDDRIVVIARDITNRKAMEAELKKAELKFRTLADKSMVGIYILQGARFVYVNPRFAEVFGYDPNEVTGFADCVEALIHDDYKATSAENVPARLEDGIEKAHYEAIGKKRDGSTNWIEFYGSRVIFDGEPTIIGTMIDITERKIAEEELKSSEQKYKLLFESSPVPLWIVAKDDLSVIAVNDAAVNLYGYTKNELLHMNVKKLRPIEDWEDQLKSYQKEVSGSIDVGIVKHLKKDGTAIFVNIISQDIMFEGRPVRLSSTNDVTEKLKAEDLLRATEANLQTILNTTDTAYALLDRNLDVLEYNNKAFAFAKNEFNFNPKNGGKLFDHIPDGRRLQFHEHIADVLNGKAIDYEINYPQHGAVDIWYYVRMFPISNKENAILGLLLEITDITERKTAEQSLQLAYERIKTNIKFIREMVWKQSHILRSPLANLKGLITILQKDPGDKESLSYIEIELERMDKVFKEMAQDSSKDEMNY